MQLNKSPVVSAIVGALVLCFAAPALAIDGETLCRDFDFSQSASASQVADASGPKNKVALLVGIGDYKDDQVTDLDAAQNDLCLMRQVLISKFGFKPSDIKILFDHEATRKNILKAIRSDLIDAGDKDTVALFYYSGHGSRLRDQQDGDEWNYDRLDETIVPYDSDLKTGRNDIRDDDFETLFASLGAAKSETLIIFDSCHSGDATRDVAPSKRLKRGLVAHEGDGRRALTDVPYTFLSAARSEQLARIGEYGNTRFSRFTFHLSKFLLGLENPTSYRDAINIVADRVLRETRFQGAQEPQLQGSGFDKLFLGSTEISSAPYLIVNPVRPGLVQINVGSVLGAGIGSIYEIYGPATAGDGPLTPDSDLFLGRATLTDVGPFVSKASTDPTLTVPQGARAILIKRSYGDLRLPIAITGPRTSRLIEAETALLKLDLVRSEPDPQDAWLVIRTEGDLVAADFPAGCSEKDPDGCLACPAGQVSSLRKCVRDWAQFDNVQRISNHSNDLTFEADLVQYDTKSACEVARAPDDVQTPLQKIILQAGNWVRVFIKNTGSNEAYFHLVQLSPESGEVLPIYPLKRTANDRDLQIAAGVTGTLPGPEGHANGLCIEVGDDEPSILKVIATYRPIDVEILAQDPAARSVTRSLVTADPLERLLKNAMIGTRGGFGEDSINLSDWATREIRY